MSHGTGCQCPVCAGIAQGFGEGVYAYMAQFPREDPPSVPAGELIWTTGIVDPAIATLGGKIDKLALTQAQMIKRIGKVLAKLQPLADGFDDVKNGRVTKVPANVTRKRKARK